jgi:hypothetical protein
LRLLVAIPHYFSLHRDAGAGEGEPRHGSTEGTPAARVTALAACVSALHQLYGPEQRMIHIEHRVARPANEQLAGPVDILICTTGGAHLIDRLTVPPGSFGHVSTEAEPRLLGFECHAALRQRLGDYDYYGYLEDDLIARDPLYFLKLAWFNAQVGDEALLQPNRYEVGPLGLVHKAYIDGDLAARVTAPFQDVADRPVLNSLVMGATVAFHRARNPHSGCFFLNAHQMAHWAGCPHFLDRDTRFIGPLESAATLGIMRAFRVYKPAPENAGFLEIEHYGTAFLSQLRRRHEAGAGP